MALLQGTNSKTYADIAAGCYYGSSALLHEVVELRVLLKRDRWLLRRSGQRIKKFLQDNEDAHVEALQVEYPYLRRKIAEILGEKVGIGELGMSRKLNLPFCSAWIARSRPKGAETVKFSLFSRWIWRSSGSRWENYFSGSALVRANASQWDFDKLFNSDLDLPIFFPADADIERARMLLDRLKRFDRSKEHGAQ